MADTSKTKDGLRRQLQINKLLMQVQTTMDLPSFEEGLTKMRDFINKRFINCCPPLQDTKLHTPKSNVKARTNH